MPPAFDSDARRPRRLGRPSPCHEPFDRARLNFLIDAVTAP